MSQIDIRALVERVDRRYRHAVLSTAPVLDAATDILAEWWHTTAGPWTTDVTDQQAVDWADRLAGIALEMVHHTAHRHRPATPAEATALLDAVVIRLGEGGIDTARDVLYVPLPRTANTPAWGAHAPRPLAITVDSDRGWDLVIHQPQGSPAVQLVGRCDATGIDAMLDLALAVNNGAYGNLFARR